MPTLQKHQTLQKGHQQLGRGAQRKEQSTLNPKTQWWEPPGGREWGWGWGRAAESRLVSNAPKAEIQSQGALQACKAGFGLPWLLVGLGLSYELLGRTAALLNS